jgi:hypothetical protein
MYKEAIVQFAFLLTEEAKHHLAQFLFHIGREIVQKTQQVFKANQFREVSACHHNFYHQKF